ncbi:hypothetical protein M0G43_04465 [Subsaxibacter sp. CAU 1640]|uniref:hypothetical protein n=1 Tax=Subsaxibacter sp. CAU 1640 TaxID=2933271 RepID=UPI0020062679|nr:hypothetical protein [Subsaxibacter sp. CAU 1640]MCK7589819.1 hypothetical protein [Subsaxibacter sp. CAU 1640]
MKKTLLGILLTIFLCNTNWAQGEMGGRQIVNDGFILTTPTQVNARVEGSPYITEDYVPARISVFENKIFAVKYDALLDEILVKKEQGTESEAYALPKNGRQDISITLLSDNKTYQIFDYVNDTSEQSTGFFILLNSPIASIKLLKKETVRFYEERVATSGYDKSRPAEYRRLNDSFYIKINDQPAIEFSNNKKDFAKLFPKNEKEILDFIKSEKIKLKEESDLVKLGQYLNQIK